MRIASTFLIPAEPARVFDAILDEGTMRQCIFGCEELERVDATHYRGRLVDEIARVRVSANFGAEIVDLDRPHRIRAVLTGEDRRLASSVKLTAALVIEPAGSESTVRYEMDLALWGRLGRLGEPIVRRRSQEAEHQFVSALSAVFCPDAPSAAESGAPSAATNAGTTSVTGPPRAASKRTGRTPWRAFHVVVARARAAIHALRHDPA